MHEVRVIKPHQRDTSTAQTPGMFRAEGAGAKTVGAQNIWVGHVSVDKGVRSGPHHHGELESVIYVISGRARFRYGERLEHSVEAEAGDFVFVPPYLVHQEINASDDEAVDMVVARSSQENIVVNVDLPAEIAEA
ncbi:MAG TPA: cupin domain-containing protein [Dehalococcoidia bacterium]|nr:cupin domain-containing protein [Dehalococcoidia bacterium]